MIKYFCDECGDEITEENRTYDNEGKPGNLETIYKSITVKIITAHHGTWNSSIFCKYCILDAVYTMDNRNEIAKLGRIND